MAGRTSSDRSAPPPPRLCLASALAGMFVCSSAFACGLGSPVAVVRHSALLMGVSIGRVRPWRSLFIVCVKAKPMISESTITCPTAAPQRPRPCRDQPASSLTSAPAALSSTAENPWRLLRLLPYWVRALIARLFKRADPDMPPHYREIRPGFSRPDWSVVTNRHALSVMGLNRILSVFPRNGSRLLQLEFSFEKDP